MNKANKIVTQEEQSIIDAGGRVESFYDCFKEHYTKEEMQVDRSAFGRRL